MDSILALINTLSAMIWQAFSLLVQLIISVLSIFLVFFEGLAHLFHLS